MKAADYKFLVGVIPKEGLAGPHSKLSFGRTTAKKKKNKKKHTFFSVGHPAHLFLFFFFKFFFLQGFFTESERATHAEHHKRFPHHCSVCIKNFQTPEMFETHKETVHKVTYNGITIDGPPFVCTLCQAVLKSKKNFYRHMEGHTEEGKNILFGDYFLGLAT